MDLTALNAANGSGQGGRTAVSTSTELGTTSTGPWHGVRVHVPEGKQGVRVDRDDSVQGGVVALPGGDDCRDGHVGLARPE